MLGQGGMSSVYQVKHMMLNKILALKMIHPHLAAEKDAIERFKREAEATSRMDHPNIIRVHDFGITDSGSPYTVMDYVEGSTLSQLISSEPHLGTERVADIMSQCCSALAHAHSKNIIHRDIKPSNIMLVKTEDNKDLVKVVDFGIAQLVTDDLSVQKLTQTGQIFGTPLYMSPEQCQGLRLDDRTDIYALGCVMYEALSGEPPLKGASVYETIFKQINEMPEGLSNSISQKKTKDTMEAIVFTAMAKAPADRYQSMLKFKEDLEAFKHDPEKSLSRGLPQVVRQWYLRKFLSPLRPLLHNAALLTLISAALLLGLGVLFFGQMKQTTVAQEPEWHKLDEEGQRLFDNGELKSAQQTFEQALSAAKQIGDRKLVLANYNEMLDLSRAQNNIVAERKYLHEVDNSKLSISDAKKLESSIDAEIQALKTKPQSLTDEENKRLHRFCAAAMDTTASIWQTGELETSRTLLDKISRLIESAFGTSDQLMSRYLDNRGHLAHDMGDYDGAIAYYQRCLELEKKILSPMHPAIAKTLIKMGVAYCQKTSNLDKAEEAFNEALEINRQLFGSGSVQVATCRYHLADLYLQKGMVGDARNEAETAVSIYERSKEPVDKENLASCYTLLGRISKKFNLCQQGLTLSEEATEKFYPHICQDLTDMADLSVEKTPRKAENYLRRANAIAKRFSVNNQDMANSQLFPIEARIYQIENKPLLASKKFKQLLELQTKLFGPQSAALTKTLSQLAALAKAQGNIELADHYYKAAFEILSSNTFTRNAVGKPIFIDYARFLRELHRMNDLGELTKEWRNLIQKK